ncbi:Signal peptidase I [Candidatus Moranella endobia PCVAL]|uniref:Signal peptidase I n=1 Tax=Moranella endobia (strain PCIT) TaxID=903503 RepID=F7XX50_MOREP|nr:signal peptidase I [Candidatus Moranella endobia]AEI74676.1 signal peptidase I [Candidatus Moranella endobia PCIT]AGJ61332.1 Signal peptidase I [Candidatus Moranella endobia PCVAL]
MANIFALMLSIATLITGIIWFIMIIKHKRRQLAQYAYQKSTDNITITAAVKDGWLTTYASLFPVLLLVFVVRSFIFEPFQIPSGSMMPTLLVGDCILVQKFAYGIKDPIGQKTIIRTSHPKHGDVVVFKYPPDPRWNYIKRVIGLPGDRIIYDFVKKSITVQPSCASRQNCTMTLPITYSAFTPSNLVQIFHSIGNGETSSSFLQVTLDRKVNIGIRLEQRNESFGGKMHQLLTVPGKKDQISIYCQQPGSSLAEWVVPKGEYFMMGDNRDNSYDSRYWGFVPEKNIVGKATAIWISFDKHEGKKWPTGLRLSRIGSSIS